MTAEAETLQFKIDDVEYDLPPLMEFDMDEWQIVFDYSGLLYSDFAPLEDEEKERERERKTNTPAFHKALIHVAYRRAHPDVNEDVIKELVRRAKQIGFLNAIAVAREGDNEEETVPLGKTTEPAPSSPKSSAASSDSESNDSTTNSDDQAGQPALTGISG